VVGEGRVIGSSHWGLTRDGQRVALNTKQYFFTNDEPPSQRWSVSMMHEIPFRTKDDSEAAIATFVIKDAAGCQELHDYLHVFRESKDSL
jgi:hypothetical protein